MRNPVDIDQLVSLARRGDTDAFGKLYDLFLDAVYRFVYFRVGKREDAEDLTEQIFVSIFEHIETYNDRGLPFGAWIFRIARNKVIDHYRTKKSYVSIDHVTAVEDDDPTPEELTDRQLSKEALTKALAKLPHTYQEIIILKYIEEKDNEEISTILEKPVAHIRVLQNRALNKLRKVVRHE